MRARGHGGEKRWVWRRKRAWKEPLEEDPMPEADTKEASGAASRAGTWRERLPTGGRGSELGDEGDGRRAHGPCPPHLSRLSLPNPHYVSTSRIPPPSSHSILPMSHGMRSPRSACMHLLFAVWQGLDDSKRTAIAIEAISAPRSPQANHEFVAYLYLIAQPSPQ